MSLTSIGLPPYPPQGVGDPTLQVAYPSGAGQAGALPRDLTPINKVTGGRWAAVMVNQDTGESFLIDREQARIRRCQRRVHAWAECIGAYLQRLGRGYRLVMQGLTYRPDLQWSAGDIKAYMGRVRRCLGGDLLAYAWVAEVTRKGQVHYHVLLLVRQGAKVPMPDKSGLWPHGSSRVESARSPFYIVAYTGKEYQKGGYPKGLRMFAVWIRQDVVERVAYWEFRLSALPAWFRMVVESVGDEVARYSRAEGGGWWFLGRRWQSRFRFGGLAWV